MSTETDPIADLAGEVLDIVGLLEYQDGAIVSRTLVEKEHTTVTLFAVDEGQRISEHSAPHDALIHVIDGRAAITVSDEEYQPAAGEGVAIPANAPHSVHAPERFKMLLIMAR